MYLESSHSSYPCPSHSRHLSKLGSFMWGHLICRWLLTIFIFLSLHVYIWSNQSGWNDVNTWSPLCQVPILAPLSCAKILLTVEDCHGINLDHILCEKRVFEIPQSWTWQRYRCWPWQGQREGWGDQLGWCQFSRIYKHNISAGAVTHSLSVILIKRCDIPTKSENSFWLTFAKLKARLFKRKS